MITEKAFSEGFSSFWLALLPLLESHIRRLNRSAERFVLPFKTSLPPSGNGLVNEVAYQLFAAAVRLGRRVNTLGDDVTTDATHEAVRHIRGLRQASRAPVVAQGREFISDAVELAGRLEAYFSEYPEQLIVDPLFRGCGWLAECRGDVIQSHALYEVKAGASAFRSIDIKQALCYCALNFEAKTYDLEAISLINPRRGVVVVEPIEDLARSAGAPSALSVLSDIIEFCSETIDREGE